MIRIHYRMSYSILANDIGVSDRSDVSMYLYITYQDDKLLSELGLEFVFTLKLSPFRLSLKSKNRMSYVYYFCFTP